MKSKIAVHAFAVLGGLLVMTGAGASDSRVVPTRRSAAIVGNLKAGSECAKGPAQAWLSVGPLLLYQVEVPVGGDFEFHTLPGKFNLVATNAAGCFVEEAVEVKDGEAKTVQLSLARPSSRRIPAGGGK